MKLFGLIGYPLTHSWSEIYFSRKFAEEGITSAKYSLFELKDISDLKELISANPNLRGFNVTIPYKEKVIPYLDELTAEAREIGAVNVVLVDRKGPETKLYGFNTDVEGFSKTLPETLHHKNALILGTGGAAKAVASVLKEKNIDFLFVSREKHDTRTITYQDLKTGKGLVQSHTLIINATPVGMFPVTDEAPDIPYDEISPEHFLYDLVYNPGNTLFMKNGSAHGARVTNGYEMFTRQAEAAFYLFKR
jgi:shikimate dehydrogenase